MKTNNEKQFNFLIAKLVYNLKRANKFEKEGNDEEVRKILKYSTNDLEVAKAMKESENA